MVLGYSFDAPAIFQSIKQIVSAADQDSAEKMDQSIKTLEELFSFSLTDDFLPALGNTIIIHDAPSQGGAIASAPVLKISLHKPEIIEQFLDKLCKFIKSNNTSKYPNEYHTREFLGHKIYNFGYDRDDDFMIHLSWTLTKDSLFLALHPSTLKAQLRLLGDDNRLKLSPETLKIFTAEAPVISCTYLNLKDSMHVLYTLVPYFITAINNEFYQEMPDDDYDIQDSLSIYSLPSLDAFIRYDAPNWSLMTKEKTGIKIHSQTSISGTLFSILPSAILTFFRIVTPH
jgi:hypothetical protein